ncbi:hypothetical protein KSS87_008138, partial [Heliosperma pusillum]
VTHNSQLILKYKHRNPKSHNSQTLNSKLKQDLTTFST